jgi:glutathione peroxidase-family protein
MELYNIVVKNRKDEDVKLDYLKGKVVMRLSPIEKPELMEEKIKEEIER